MLLILVALGHPLGCYFIFTAKRENKPSTLPTFQGEH